MVGKLQRMDGEEKMKATFEGILNLSNEEWEQKKKEIESFRNCTICNARLVMNLCHLYEDKYYCEEHCPEHKWQSDYDWVTECAKCGLHYEHYLQKLLEDNKISYLKR
jgi:hypothetical protein